VRLLRDCFLDEAADVRQAGVGSARAARLDRRRVGIQANDAHALVRLNAGGGHWGKKNSFFTRNHLNAMAPHPSKRHEVAIVGAGVVGVLPNA
jgi:hypothetical protein